MDREAWWVTVHGVAKESEAGGDLCSWDKTHNLVGCDV